MVEYLETNTKSKCVTEQNNLTKNIIWLDRKTTTLQRTDNHSCREATNLGLAIRQIFGQDSDSYKNPSKNKTDLPRIPDSYFFDGFRILAIF